ncbi:MAG: hypothetical protein Q9220_001567 [cf. Caloplaca sp. 1 TL-2023]
MADQAKEQRLMTVFDRGSYLYLYKNTTVHGGRIEVANNVGKPEQDAFTGGHTSSTTSPPQHPEHHWRLPNTDPRNEGKYLFRLHTLDIYFWTVADATSFMSSIEDLVDSEQVEIMDRPAAPAAHERVMSPVVQKLESVAIEDSAYHNGQTRSSKPAAPSFAPPPKASTENQQPAASSNGKETFKPLAYNPAAPAAPEPIKHREKTPPPPEAETEGTGLAAAAYNDHQHSVSSFSQSGHGSLSRPPYPSSSHTSAYTSPQPPGSPYASPPPFAGLTGVSPVPGGRIGSVSSLPPPPPQGGRTPSVASAHVPSSSPSMQVQGHPNAAIPQFSLSQPPRNPNAFQSGGSQPLDSPSAQILGNSYIGPPPQPLQHLQPQYADYLANRPQQTSQGQAQEPVGGYANYNYSQPHHHSHSHQHGGDYDVHNQLYRPTEEEAHRHKHHRPSDAGQPTGKLEQSAGRIDKGVNRFFKKLEKKIG